MEALVNEKTRLILLNNPNNPTGKVIDETVLDKIVQIANDKGITILADEVYSDISFVKTKSILDYGDNHVITKSFSKTFAMTGWRIGYVVVKKELADRIMKLNQITLTNIPVFIQEAALKALELRDAIIEKIKEEYQKRTNLACEILSKTKMKFSRPEAPFYLFPKYSGLDSEKFTLDLLDKGVAVAPGTAFGDYREHFRISLTASQKELELALKKICEALD